MQAESPVVKDGVTGIPGIPESTGVREKYGVRDLASACVLRPLAQLPISLDLGIRRVRN